MCRHNTRCDARCVGSGAAGTVELLDDSDADATSGTADAGSGAKRADSETGSGTGVSSTGAVAEHSDADACFDLHDSAQPGGTRQTGGQLTDCPFEVSSEFGRAARP